MSSPGGLFSSIKNEGCGGRELRTRKHRRHIEDPRPQKQLFTPEIKRRLKAWLVRRRNHPYPTREEKKDLAVETGLTYVQICNWFANWRRKLKNTGNEVDSHTWTTLIKSYNGHVEGNVEQFSLTSGDSIWEEADAPSGSGTSERRSSAQCESQCFQISSTSDIESATRSREPLDSNGNYPQKNNPTIETETPLLLKRWLESAACFRPRQNSQRLYLSQKPFSFRSRMRERNAFLSQSSFQCKTSSLYEDILSSMHGQEELAAAEALTFLSKAARSKVQGYS